MLIEEIVRSCANERVAQAAIASIGKKFYGEISERAAAYGVTVGAFTSLSIDLFLRHGDEAELRSVIAAMKKAQEPLLTGLHRILCMMLASGMMPDAPARKRDRTPRIAAQLCALDLAEVRRDLRV